LNLIWDRYLNETPVKCKPAQALRDTFGKEPLEVLKSVDYIVVLEEG